MSEFATGYDLSGRVALVTGGGSGIGFSTALLLARYGADLVIAGRNPDTLEAAATELRTTGRTVLTIPTDVRDDEQAMVLVEKAAAHFGRLDILINNAGRAAQGSLASTTPDAWRGEFELNTHAAFYCAQATFPHLAKHGNGAVVNVSSYTGLDGVAGAGAYSSAKAALQMFTRVAAAEWGPKGVRVNCVAPGITASDTAKARWAAFDFDYEAACRIFALRRAGKPDEVARAIVFLASDAASYVTGETLAVIGGRGLGGMVDDL